MVLASESVPNKYLGLGLGSIPSGQWACAFAAWLILLGLMKCMPYRLTKLPTVIQATFTCFVYAVFVIVAFVFQRYADKVDIPFMVGTYVLVFLNIIGCALAWFWLPRPHHFDSLPESEEPIRKNQVDSDDSRLSATNASQSS